MAQLTILHNPKCSTSKHAMDEISAAGADAEVVQYLKTPLDRAELLALMAKLEDPPADLVRKDGFFKELGLAPDDWASSSAAATPEAVADLLVEHPRLMQRPVLVRGDRAIIGRPKDRVPAFLAG
jgi:arsenate reductase (glutaredoxin)